MITLQPEFVDAWIHKGQSLKELGKYPDALTAFKRALELDATRKEVWKDIGSILDTIGKHEDAQICYDKSR